MSFKRNNSKAKIKNHSFEWELTKKLIQQNKALKIILVIVLLLWLATVCYLIL